jgi:osmotically inducible lipoprotein OsmB
MHSFAWPAHHQDISTHLWKQEILMTSRIIRLSFAATVVISMAACSNMSTRDRNTAAGAAIGGAAGAVLTGGSGIGTVGGAAVGGIIGNQVGK